MTGDHGAGKDQLYGNSLLLSPRSFEDRAAAAASIIGTPCKVALYVKIEVVESRNDIVRAACSSVLQQIFQGLLRPLYLRLNGRSQLTDRRFVVAQRRCFQPSQYLGQSTKTQ